MDQERWAGAHFRVERESAGVVMRKRQFRKATEQAIEFGDPVPETPSDVVRIYDRQGEVVFEHDWGSRRSDAMAQEARIVDDLLRLDVNTFAAKYGIIGTQIPRPADAGPAPEPIGEHPSDLPVADEPPGRSEQGSG